MASADSSAYGGIEIDPGVLDKQVAPTAAGVPAQPAPDRFVDIVVNPVRIGNETVAVRGEAVVNGSELSRAEIDRLASQR